ncbi:MAG TPA: hypothetical protein VGM30_09490 [Puia sp.]
MKTIVFLTAAIAVFGSTGCSVLSDSQVKNINVFAVAASGYTSYPSEIFKKKADLHLHNELLETLSFPDFDHLDKRVDKAKTQYNTDVATSAKFDKSIQLLGQYAGLLVELSSDKYTKDLTGAASGLGNDLTGLVSAYNTTVPAADTLPAGISGEISNVILAGGRRLTRIKQAKELQEFIPLGDKLVQQTVQNLVAALDSLKPLLDQEKQDFVQNSRNILFSGKGTGNYDSLRQYYDAKVDYDNTELLRQKCIATAKQLATAHAALAKSIAEKRNLPGIITETQGLVTDFQDMGKIASHWSSDIKLPTIKH